MHNASEREIGPPDGSSDCCPEIQIATATEFRLVNRNKVNNFIWGELNGGELSFIVENKPKDGTGCPGKWMFSQMMSHFGSSVTKIIGSWTYGDNLATVNKLTAGGNVTVETAAKKSWTGERAAEHGFPQVEQISTKGSPGNYTSIKVRFKA